MGQVVGAIVADTQRHAQTAAKKVKVECQQLPSLLTIEVSCCIAVLFLLAKQNEREDQTYILTWLLSCDLISYLNVSSRCKAVMQLSHCHITFSM